MSVIVLKDYSCTCSIIIVIIKNLLLHYLTSVSGIVIQVCWHLFIHLGRNSQKFLRYRNWVSTVNFRHFISYNTGARKGNKVLTLLVLLLLISSPKTGIIISTDFADNFIQKTQKGLWLCWYPAGTQGQSSISKTTSWVDGLPKKLVRDFHRAQR